MLSALRERRLIWPGIATLLGVAILIALGNRQVRRPAWTEELAATIAKRAEAQPLTPDQTARLKCSMVDSVGLAKSCEYVRVLVRGVFDHSRERHVFAGVQNVGTDSTRGYWVFTPFTPNGAGAAGATNPGGRPILVNRGFVPEGFKEHGTRSDGQIANEVEIVVQVRTRELRKWSDGANTPEKNIYFVREPRELGILYPKQINDVPVLTAGYFYLEVVGDAPRGGFPKPIASTIEVSNRHPEYALTWYGLAVALVGFFLAFAASRWQRPKGASRD